ncbi:MAG: pilus assembly protein PilP [Desulfobacterium sp.]|nr:pilus assembly protein PilP [Desulfobacterium sp.]
MHAWIKIKTTFLFGVAMALGCMGLVACQEPPPRQEVEPRQVVVSMKVPPSPPAVEPVSEPEAEVVNFIAVPGDEPDLSSTSFALEPYSPTDKINPFIPLVQTRPQTTIPVDKGEKKPTRALTPLEKFDLSQVRLVAVVLAESGKIAMIEEASGKGYVVRVGTYIGKDAGTVVQILKDRIVINETITDFRGEEISRTREMKLHKQEIEG